MKPSNLKNVSVRYTILFGVVSSALWTLAYEKFFPQVTAYFVDISSYFSKRVFLEISTHDPISLQQSTYSILLFLTVIFVILITSLSYLSLVYIKDQISDTKNKTDNLGNEILGKRDTVAEVTEQDVIQSYEDLVKEVDKTDKFIKKSFFPISILLSISAIFLVASFFYTTLTTKYVYESISYFNYLLKVNAVYLNDETERQYVSRFAQIRDSDDYITIIVELEKLALKNNLSFVPNPTVRKEEDLIKDHPSSKQLQLKDL